MNTENDMFGNGNGNTRENKNESRLGECLTWYPVLQNILRHLDPIEYPELNLVSRKIHELKRYLIKELRFQYFHIIKPHTLDKLLIKYPNVDSLHIHQTSYPILYVIGQYPRITHLYVRVYGVFSFYTELIPQITHLDMSRSIYLNEVLYYLSDLPNLKWLNISNNRYITQMELMELLRRLEKTEIETLIIRNLPRRYTADLYADVEHLLHLRELDISGSQFTYDMNTLFTKMNDRRVNKGLGAIKVIH